MFIHAICLQRRPGVIHNLKSSGDRSFHRHCRCRASAEDQQTERPLAPWVLTFDLRERETIWTEENQARLVKIVAGYELELSENEVEERLQELAIFVPSLRGKLAHTKPSLLAALLKDPGAVVSRLITLKNLLPDANICFMAGAEPEMLLIKDLSLIQQDIAKVKLLLGVERLDLLAEAEPRVLNAEVVEEVLEEMNRLMPGSDCSKVLIGDPSWISRLERGRKHLGDDPD